MFEWLTTQVSDNPITYLVVLVSAAADVLFPAIPSETIIIAASVIAGQGGLLLGLIVIAAALGAFVGDNVSFLLGRRVGDPVARRIFRSDDAKARLRWAEREIRAHGAVLVLVGRFIPGGRTATTFGAGTLGMDYRRFLLADAIGALLWALYVSMLGYLGGSTFEDSFWLPLLIAIAVVFVLGLLAEGVRRLLRRRRGRGFSS